MRLPSSRYLLAALTACLLLLAPAGAYGAFSGGTGGGGGCSSCGTGLGSGGGGGTVNVWLPYSLDKQLYWFSNQDKFSLAYDPGQSPSNGTYTKLDQNMTLALLGYSSGTSGLKAQTGVDAQGMNGPRCSASDWYDRSYCPLWYTVETQQPFDSPLPGAADWAYNDHGGDPAGELIRPVDYVGSHAILDIWNVRVWRYDPETAATQADSENPILDRTVDLLGGTVQGTPYEATSTTSGDYDAYWYYAGDFNAGGFGSAGSNAANGGGSGGSAGTFANDYTSAGPLYTLDPGYTVDKQDCDWNIAHSANGTRDTYGRVPGQAKYDPSEVVKEQTKLPGNTYNGPIRPHGAVYDSNGNPTAGDFVCYWEGPQIPREWNLAGYDVSHGLISGRLAGVPADQFGNSDSSDPTKQDDPLQRAGLEEAIRLDWSTALEPNRVGSISYKIQGVPNHWYAIQIVGMDNRQQLIDQNAGGSACPADTNNDDTFPCGSDPGGGSAAANTNYFRAFIADPAPCVSGEVDCPVPCTTSCCTAPCNGTPPSVPGAEATPYVNLTGETPVAARDNGNGVLGDAPWQQLTIKTDDVLTDQQAIFPLAVNLQHFTPQMAYNGARSASESVQGAYQSNYITYGNAAWVLPTDRLGLSTAEGPDPTHAFFNKSVQTQLASVTPDQDGGGDSVFSQNKFYSVWLQPTLQNPCPVQSDERDLQTGAWLSWPANPASCSGTGTFNAWDDYFSGLASWESRWVSSMSTSPTYGYITNQQLRCGNPDSASSSDHVDASTGAVTPSCNDYLYYGVSANTTIPGAHILLSATENGLGDIFHTQQAQGYVYVAADHSAPAQDVSDGAGALRTQLSTDTGARLSASAVWDRTSGAVKGLSGRTDATAGAEKSNTDNPSGWNPVKQDYEMNFCEQGMPSADDHLAFRTSATGDDDKVGDARVGDPGCNGYDVQWQWAAAPTPTHPDQAYTDACNAQPIYDGDPPTPGWNWFPAPANPDTSLADSGSYGTSEFAAGMEQTYEQSAVYRTGLSFPYTGAVSPPYTGQRPGQKKLSNGALSGNFVNAGCSKPVSEDGLYNSGYWSFNYSFWPKLGPAKNCPFASDPNADTADYGTFALNTPEEMGGYRPDDSVGSITGGVDVPGTSTNCNDGHWTYKTVHHPASCTGSGKDKVCTPAWDETVKDKYIPDTYKYGFWYRTSVQWNWTGPCEPVDQISGWPSHKGVPDDPTDPSVDLPANTDTAIDYVSAKVSWPDTAPPDATSYGDKADHWNAGAGYSSNLVDIGDTTLTSYKTTDGGHTRIPPQELAARSCTATPTRSGYLTWNYGDPAGSGGSWTLHTPAGPGWGKNNTGPRLPTGGYVVQYTFSNLQPGDVNNGNGWWSLNADYDGHTDWTWSHEMSANFQLSGTSCGGGGLNSCTDPGTPQNPNVGGHLQDSTMLVSVSSPRNQR